MTEIPPAPSYYEKPEEKSLLMKIIFLLLSLALIVISSIIIFSFDWLTNFGIYLLSFVGPLLYLQFIWRKDKYEPEPLYYVAEALALGALAAIPAVITNIVFAVIANFLFGLGNFLSAVVSAPFFEELYKGIPLLFLVKSKEFNNETDGVVYGFAIGMGFASLENFGYSFYVYEQSIILILLRIFLFSFGHGVYTAFTGYYLGYSKTIYDEANIWWIVKGLKYAICFHFLYNFLISIIGGIFGIIVGLIIDSSAFFILLLLLKKALRREVKWGYADGRAPV